MASKLVYDFYNFWAMNTWAAVASLIHHSALLCALQKANLGVVDDV